MKKETLIKRLSNMKYGDCFGIEFYNEYVTYITKTTWIESNFYIIGGVGDEIKTITIYNDKEEDLKSLNELIDNIFSEFNLDENINITINDKSTILIQRIGGDSLKYGRFDNMILSK